MMVFFIVSRSSVFFEFMFKLFYEVEQFECTLFSVELILNFFPSKRFNENYFE